MQLVFILSCIATHVLISVKQLASVKYVAIQYNQNMLLTITSLVINNNSLIRVNTNTSKISVEQYKFDFIM